MGPVGPFGKSVVSLKIVMSIAESVRVPVTG